MERIKKLERLTVEADVYYRIKINELVETVNLLIDKIERTDKWNDVTVSARKSK